MSELLIGVPSVARMCVVSVGKIEQREGVIYVQGRTMRCDMRLPLGACGMT